MSDKKLKIVVTDSGLGGLSVYAKISRRIQKESIAEKSDIIYFNSVPDKYRGYNSMETETEKIAVFNSALNSIYNNFAPDYIFIACNTLSAFFRKTDFYASGRTNIIGIIDLGVNLAREVLSKDPFSNLIIIGTSTTIDSGLYQSKLINAGYPENKIIPQACPNLESEIQDDPESRAVHQLLQKYLTEIKERCECSKKSYILLGCTHFDLIEDKILAAAELLGFQNIEIINPNYAMVSFPFEKVFVKSCKEISHKMVSKTKLLDHEIEIFYKLLNPVSPQAAEALRNYSYIPDLF